MLSMVICLPYMAKTCPSNRANVPYRYDDLRKHMQANLRTVGCNYAHLILT